MSEGSEKSMSFVPENKVYVMVAVFGETGSRTEATTHPMVRVRLAVTWSLPLELTCVI